MASAEDLFRRIRRCRKCERSQTRERAVPGEGPVGADFFLLGEAPGKQEDKAGRPFVGRSGRYLQVVLEESGVLESDVFVTSILKCYHPGPAKKHQVQACKPWTFQQVEAVGPRKILVMGLTAAAGLLGRIQLGIEPVAAEWRGIPCIVTCHPASAMRFPQRDKQFRRGVRRLVRE